MGADTLSIEDTLATAGEESDIETAVTAIPRESFASLSNLDILLRIDFCALGKDMVAYPLHSVGELYDDPLFRQFDESNSSATIVKELRKPNGL